VIRDSAAARREMVERQLRKRGIRDERVLQALGAIPREEFVPEQWAAVAYVDKPIQIGYDQTISQPFITGLMAEALDLRGDETVLEVGAGSGYAAAVLGLLARRVVAVEIVPELADIARANLRRTGLDANVIIVEGDGSAGYPPGAPFDAISVAAAAPDIPVALLAQLHDPGRLVIPVGGWDEQDLRVVTKRGGQIDSRVATSCRFVPLRGEEGWR
jgi:protein-L-isoaspartate(D-aspartate) O-methyltransferase